MIEITDKKLCSGCSACSRACPVNCIEMVADEEGFLYPKVDKEKCINCGRCEQVCPVLTKKYEDIDELPMAYLCYEEDVDSRIDSAAGGAFYSIAKGFIEKYKGVVFGAVYDDDFRVKHDYTETVEGLKALQKSKYVQSDMKDAFDKVQEFLKADRYVLYSGTPCQVAGLNRFLPDSLKEKLYTVDLSCHGVPSPKVFASYIDFQKDKNGPIEKVIIRDKKIYKTMYRQGYGVLFKDGKKYFEPHGVDPMARVFFHHLTLRPICHECPFKTVARISDVTLGDCWYAEEFMPDFVDRYGITMLLAQSDKAADLIECATGLVKEAVDSEKLIKINGGMIFKSSAPHKDRDKYFERFNSGELDFDKLADEFVPVAKDSFKYKLTHQLKEMKLLPKSMQQKKRKKEINRRLAMEIPEKSYKRFV